MTGIEFSCPPNVVRAVVLVELNGAATAAVGSLNCWPLTCEAADSENRQAATKIAFGRLADRLRSTEIARLTFSLKLGVSLDVAITLNSPERP